MWNIFETKELCDNSLDYIAVLREYPSVGTTRWARSRQIVGGQWGYISYEPAEEIEEFKTLFPHTQEEFDKNWFPPIEQ